MQPCMLELAASLLNGCSLAPGAAGRAYSRACLPLQVFSSSLQQVVDIVVSHQALREKCKLVSLLLDAIVRPAPELFRPQLRRMTFLLGELEP